MRTFTVLQANGHSLVLDVAGPRTPRVQHALKNIGVDACTVNDLNVALPLPARASEGVELPGRVLAEVGLQPPILTAEQAMLVEITAV